MLLGDLISRFDDETAVLAALSALDDPRLLELAQQAAAADGLPLGTWAQETVGRFAASADDERWLGLLAVCRSTPDPGSAALRYMLTATLASRTAKAASAA
jgi:hypothetical protein